MHFFCKCLKINIGNFYFFRVFSEISREKAPKQGSERTRSTAHVCNYKERARAHIRGFEGLGKRDFRGIGDEMNLESDGRGELGKVVVGRVKPLDISYW